jgi:outer membrane autotransporter protein
MGGFRTKLARGVVPGLALAICAGLQLSPAVAQSLDSQYVRYLISACRNLEFDRVPDQFGDPVIVAPGQAGPELAAYCSRPPPTAGGDGTISATTGSGTAADAAADALRRRQGAQRNDDAAGAGPDEFGVLSTGLVSLFASLNFAREDQQAQRFEGGRRADQFALTFGVDRRLGTTGLLGVAAAIEDQAGHFDAGGTFDARSYSALLYGSWMPWSALFVDLHGGFALRDTETSRTVSFRRSVPLEFVAPARAESSADQREWRAALLSGYDFSSGRSSLGPRLNVEYRRTAIDGYAESGTAMALAVGKQAEKSLRSSLGLQGSLVMNVKSAVSVLQLNADWWHEFQDDQRFITARFAQDLRPDPVRFRYQNEPPDRDVFTARLSLSLTMPHGLSAFASVDGLFGHSYLHRYGAALGLRKEL